MVSEKQLKTGTMNVNYRINETKHSEKDLMILSHYRGVFLVIQCLFDDHNEACPEQPDLADLASAEQLE